MNAPLLVITGDKPRHLYFAQYLLSSFAGSRLIIERQPQAAWGAHVPQDVTPLVQEHFERFNATERAFFDAAVEGAMQLIRERTALDIDTGRINDPEVIGRIAAMRPQCIATLSTSILKEPFIEAFPGMVVNYHAGLSPYYRGSGTNVFPIINGEPQYVGVTIHYIDAGIDSGDIIIQGRPAFEPGDDSHTLGCKTHMVGTELMRRAAERLLQGRRPQGRKQDLSRGRFYARAAFDDAAVLALRAALAGGVVDDYARRGPADIEMAADFS